MPEFFYKRVRRAPTPSTRTEYWTDDRTALLTKLWGDGFSASQVSARLGGTTRNAVIGKVSRLGLPIRANTGRRRRDPSIRNAATKQARRRDRAQAQVALEPMPLPDSAMDLPRIAFADLEAHHCRWPSAQSIMHYCGLSRAPGCSYCAGHLKRSTRAFVPKARAETWVTRPAESITDLASAE